MQFYYSRRAREHESAYHHDDPACRNELVELERCMQGALNGCDVLEIACGTGYWTERAAAAARRVTATDMTMESLDIAIAKDLSQDKVRFIRADAFALDKVPGPFNAGLAAFWLSHVPKSRLNAFLDGFHARLDPGSVVFMSDNSYVEEAGGELFSREGEEDTYKLRTLSDGTRHEILKNYYRADDLIGLFTPRAIELQVQVSSCFWWVRYRLP